METVYRIFGCLSNLPFFKRGKSTYLRYDKSFIISSDWTEIKLCDSLEQEIKKDEDFQKKFYEEFIGRLESFENQDLSLISDNQMVEIANEIYSKLIISIKLFPMTEEFIQLKMKIYKYLTLRDERFRAGFKKKYWRLHNVWDKYQGSERLAICGCSVFSLDFIKPETDEELHSLMSKIY